MPKQPSSPRPAMWGLACAGAFALACAGLSCKREERITRVDPPDADTVHMTVTTDLHAGPSTMATTPASTQGTTQPAATQAAFVWNGYEENAYATSEGKRWYESYNCVGCHAHGGGDKGPALMDEKWIYGSRPDQIFATIVQGRPNGMPSFRKRIPDYQVWQIVAYVRSMSGQLSPNVAPGRDDHMRKGIPENTRPAVKPVDVGHPGGSPG